MSPTIGVGRTLRSERERQGLSIRKVSRVCGIDEQRLETIEAGDLDRLPPGAFAKGFIRTYATYLGVEPQPLLAAYESSFGDPLDAASLNHEPLRLPRAHTPKTWRMAAVGAFAFILLLASVGAFQKNDLVEPPRFSSTAALGSQDAVSGAAPTTEGSPVLLTIDAKRGKSWLKVIEDGETSFEGTLQRDESKTFLASDTILVTLGNPQAVTISANGKELGAPVSSEYTAVFTSTTDVLPPTG